MHKLKTAALVTVALLAALLILSMRVRSAGSRIESFGVTWDQGYAFLDVSTKDRTLVGTYTVYVLASNNTGNYLETRSYRVVGTKDGSTLHLQLFRHNCAVVDATMLRPARFFLVVKKLGTWVPADRVILGLSPAKAESDDVGALKYFGGVMDRAGRKMNNRTPWTPPCNAENPPG